MPASEPLLSLAVSTSLGEVVLFDALNRSYTVDDVVASGVFRGDLDQPIQETLASIAAETMGEAQDCEVNSETLQSRSERFRYHHELITAGETEAWLNTRGMTPDDFTGWFLREWYRETLPPTAHDITYDELPRMLRVHLWMSGGMQKLERALQSRIAAYSEASTQGTPVPVGDQRESFLERQRLDESDLSRWLEGIGRDAAWIDEMVKLEAAYQQECRLAIGVDARQRQLAAMGLSLERIGIETLEFDSEAPAREAFLCVVEDGMSLPELARESGFRSEHSEVWLDSIEPSLGQRLLCAEEGEALEPVEVDGAFRVFQVVRKFEPSIDDPAVIRRLDNLILDQRFTALLARHIRTSEAFRISQ